jgi:hypothetical protein
MSLAETGACVVLLMAACQGQAKKSHRGISEDPCCDTDCLSSIVAEAGFAALAESLEPRALSRLWATSRARTRASFRPVFEIATVPRRSLVASLGAPTLVAYSPMLYFHHLPRRVVPVFGWNPPRTSNFNLGRLSDSVGCYRWMSEEIEGCWKSHRARDRVSKCPGMNHHVFSSAPVFLYPHDPAVVLLKAMVHPELPLKSQSGVQDYCSYSPVWPNSSGKGRWDSGIAGSRQKSHWEQESKCGLGR